MMNKRWQANRMGFVNFWLYDEEEFFFDRGRLLLRGENASGKSITTQSMIPFILDGDRSPERLDPFGSRDRKMDYYLLGDNEREEATGYIFLEFKKQDLDQYCTIGIGQRAQRGKSMTFWGFVILDNRRIGKDLQLYQQVGSKKIPKTKQELKNDLGLPNVFVDKQKEYMEEVNKHIFGFSRPELYEQFIRLLIKVRAPKLSKDLKPSMVYDILNESLQTLSDDDISSLVNSMEQLDTIQATIDGLKNTMKDVNIIRLEYDRYNRYMLSTKAKRYSQHHQSFKQECASLEEKQQEQISNRQKQQEMQRQLQEDQDQIVVLEEKKLMINAQDIRDKFEELESAKNTLKSKQEEKQEQDSKLHEIDEKIMDNEEKLSVVNDRIEKLRYDLETYQSDIRTTCEELNFSLKIQFNEGEGIILNLLDQSYKELALLKEELKAAYESLLAYEQENKLFGNLNEALSKISVEQGQIQNRLDQARRSVDSEKDAFIETLLAQKSNNKYLRWEDNTLSRMQGIILNYQSVEQREDMLDIYRSVYDNQRNKKTTKKLELQVIQSQHKEAVKNIRSELELLKAVKEPTITHREKVKQTRDMLKQKGIRCIPFYQAVEFSDSLSEQKQDLLEAQLSECGVLDALIVAEADMHLIQQEWDAISDMILVPTKSSGKSFSYLRPGDIDSVFMSQLEHILCSIGSQRNMSCDIILEDSGYFRHGLLEGHCIADESACFIGLEARKRKHQQMIAEKEQELAGMLEQSALTEKALSALDEELACLKQEFLELPNFNNLNSALAMVQKETNSLIWKQEQFAEKEAEVKASSEKRSHLYQEMLNRCRKFNFERTSDRYKLALADCEDLKEYFDKYKNYCSTIVSQIELSQAFLRTADEYEQSKDSVAQHLSLIIREIRKTESIIHQLESILNQPENIDVLKQLERIEKELKELKDRVDDNNKEVIRLEEKQKQLSDGIDELQELLQSMKRIDEELFHIYKEEFDLAFVFDQENKNPIECLAKVVECISDKDKDRSPVAITEALSKNFRQHSSNLLSYGAVQEDLFDDHPEHLRRRSVIRLNWNGQKLNLEQFYNVLKDSVETNELMIQEKDRKVFEDILSGTISQKLSNRIADSRKWIAEMSDMMWNMDTSMGLNFKLKWKAKNPESDQELNVEELEKLLNRDKELLAPKDILKVSAHFRSKIHTAKMIAEEKGDFFNYGDLIRDALDYRKWFEFHMYFAHAGEAVKELTNSAFNKFSGGEKAMAMYVPLFAAVNAQYKKCEKAEHPRIIALDEAFAGVDDKNISVMFDLVEKLDFDYIMNSQALWGCYAEVSSLHIAELVRPVNSKVITVINYHWNGKKREVV